MSRPLRVAMVAACPFPWPRGTPLRIQRLAEAVARRGHEVHVVTYHLGAPDEGSTLLIHRTPALPTYRKYSPGPTYQKLLLLDPLLARSIHRVLREQDIDVVHAHHIEGLLAAAPVCRRTGHPVIYDVHALLEAELPYYALGISAMLKRRIGRMLDGYAPRRADHVIAVSEAIRDQILAKGDVSPDGITVVASGVELDFSAQIRDRAANTPQTNFRVVYTGTLAPYQGIELLLRAFAQVIQKNDRARLVIVTGSSFDSYDDLAESLGIRGRIELVHGDLDAEITQLATASVLVNPRIDNTGLPQKLLNYMAAGKPIVSFRSSAPVLTHGRSGILVEDGNVGEFAQAILRLLDSPKLSLELGENAGAAARVEYTWDVAAQAVESIYRSLLARRLGGRS